ncbi:MAG: DUF72 domain-containing protein [Thiohalocapsa sp.]|jgi:uncharacterized protein YecE (DUF72 family)|uniref:DUF72 domain-containing protein n=1 Tax=Thiohalocapsa sp. TaxID=2497641 RepID=UPI0025F9866C|nr:DUF72 domain-containing protein [Thiohalocapsa sp.]MCG6942332.1 DUF72 domain-containing protein [Thiohalocapsa sp.]
MAAPYIGTSGWSYDHWHGPFYPAGLPPGGRLGHYAGRLGSVEIDNTFYKLPDADTLVKWRETVPPGFVFATKASRYITHMKKLKDPGDNVPGFVARMDALGEQLGPILFQLPPRWHRNTERLGAFLDTLEARHRWAFELRDRSWIDAAVLALLTAHNAAFCIYELDGYLSPAEVTADFVYIRLHGPDGAYRGNYDAAALDHWAEQISRWLGRGLDVYCYFDNDQAGYAARNALALSQRLASDR